MAAYMENRSVLNLMDAENSSTGSSASGHSPACKRARVDPFAGPYPTVVNLLGINCFLRSVLRFQVFRRFLPFCLCSLLAILRS